MAVVLYKCDGSAPSRGVLMTIEILGINDKIKLVEVSPLEGQHLKPEFLKKNHLHTVPVLEDGDLTLADSHVIMTYLVAKYAPESTLYPKDLATKSKVDEKLYLESTALTPKIITSCNAFKKGMDLSEEQIKALDEAYGFIDKFLEKTTYFYLATDYLTLADVSCVSSLASLNVILKFDPKHKKLIGWFERLKNEEWFKKVNAPGVAIFEDYLKQIRKK